MAKVKSRVNVVVALWAYSGGAVVADVSDHEVDQKIKTEFWGQNNRVLGFN